MKIAFAKLDWWNPLDLAIALCSGGVMVHVELVLDDGISYSSRPPGGTNFRKINLDTKDWVVLDLPPVDEDLLMNFFFDEINCGYDWTGVLAFVCPWIQPSKKRWFCSEFVISALQKVGLHKELVPYKTSPQVLFEKVSEISFHLNR
jgi:hypothetical protein